MFYLLFKHFDPFLNLYPSLYVHSIKKKAEAIVQCMSIYLSYSQKNIPIIFKFLTINILWVPLLSPPLGLQYRSIHRSQLNSTYINILFFYLLHFYNSTILHARTLPKKHKLWSLTTNCVYSILQLYDSTWTRTIPKNTNYDHWLLLAYIQFYNSTILQLYEHTLSRKPNYVSRCTHTFHVHMYIYYNYTIINNIYVSM